MGQSFGYYMSDPQSWSIRPLLHSVSQSGSGEKWDVDRLLQMWAIKTIWHFFSFLFASFENVALIWFSEPSERLISWQPVSTVPWPVNKSPLNCSKLPKIEQKVNWTKSYPPTFKVNYSLISIYQIVNWTSVYWTVYLNLAYPSLT